MVVCIVVGVDVVWCMVLLLVLLVLLVLVGVCCLLFVVRCLL